MGKRFSSTNMGSSLLKQRVLKSRALQSAPTSVALLGIGVLLAFLGSCAGVDKPEPGPRLPSEDLRFLVPPSSGYPLALRPGEADRFDAAFDNLIREGQRDKALSLSQQVLSRDPDFYPATVLAAQVAFVDRNFHQAKALLTPQVAELAQYTSWQLLLGRSAEKLSDLVSAYEAYEYVAEASPAARSRTRELGPRVAQVLAQRIESDLQKGSSEEAMTELARMEMWLPEETLTLESAAAVAQATSNPEAELKAVSKLSARDPGDRSLAERQAVLELEVGDAGAGLRIFQELASEHPQDAELQDQLARARFLWRLQLLPIEARGLVSQAALSRGDFSAMLYWLFPEVRYGQSKQVRIANDVLDHPYREEIVRVVNLGIMDIDDRLHQFSPNDAVTRAAALTSMVRLLIRKQPPLACVGGLQRNASLDFDTVCGVVASCGLIAASSDCRRAAAVSGTEAVELSRLTLNLLGVPQ